MDRSNFVHRYGATVAVVALSGSAFVVAACDDTQHQARPVAKPSITSSPSPTPSAPGDAALAAYRGMWAAFVAASNNGQADPPALRKYTTGSALQTLNKGLALNKSRSQKTKGAPTMKPELTSIGPGTAQRTATVADCVDSTRWLLYQADGRLVDNKPGGRRQVTATVTEVGGTWKVTTFAARGVGTC